MSDDLRKDIRTAITNAYYDARNDGRTMESAADIAADAVMVVVAAAEGPVMIARMMERRGELEACGQRAVLTHPSTVTGLGGHLSRSCTHPKGHDGPHDDGQYAWIESVR